MDQGLERWIKSTAKRNHWRVASWYELEDLIQDGYLCYSKCAARYGRLGRKRNPTKENRRNFMALVKRTYENHIHDLAAERTAQPEKPISQLHGPDDTAEAWLERHGSIEQAIADLAMVLKTTPKEIGAFLGVLTNDAFEGIAYVRVKRRRAYVRETTNEHYCRLLGLDPKTIDIVEEVRQYFGADPSKGYA